MFTLSMGSLTLKCALLIYGWLPAHITLVMGVAIFLINIGTINKKYFGIIKSTSLTAMDLKSLNSLYRYYKTRNNFR